MNVHTKSLNNEYNTTIDDSEEYSIRVPHQKYRANDVLTYVLQTSTVRSITG